MDSIVGAFDPAIQGTPLLLSDSLFSGAAASTAQRTTGATVVQRVPTLPGPGGMSLFGWTLKYDGYVIGNYPQGALPVARFGDLWGGVVADPTIPTDTTTTAQGAGGNFRSHLPSDLSSFAKVYSGADDRCFTLNTLSNQTQYQDQDPRSFTYMLPQPMRVDEGRQLAFMVVLTPSILLIQSGAIWPLIRMLASQASYTLYIDRPT